MSLAAMARPSFERIEEMAKALLPLGGGGGGAGTAAAGAAATPSGIGGAGSVLPSSAASEGSPSG